MRAWWGLQALVLGALHLAFALLVLAALGSSLAVTPGLGTLALALAFVAAPFNHPRGPRGWLGAYLTEGSTWGYAWAWAARARVVRGWGWACAQVWARLEFAWLSVVGRALAALLTARSRRGVAEAEAKARFWWAALVFRTWVQRVRAWGAQIDAPRVAPYLTRLGRFALGAWEGLVPLAARTRAGALLSTLPHPWDPYAVVLALIGAYLLFLMGRWVLRNWPRKG